MFSGFVVVFAWLRGIEKNYIMMGEVVQAPNPNTEVAVTATWAV